MKGKKEVMNGNMVSNFEEMREHGKAMEQMKTNKELKQEGKHPDPAQLMTEKSH